uniref:cytochrome c oxidase subunit III n=1 Tax=Phraortes lianzhouensis TaxID=3050175 RepID=UPI0025A9606F|nr:cytochrome c oxidase subunit III [Phraortes lianzhouensis]WID87086.1 cytochrome c oxidase subunit III [Phraortes lianzhouensis]
MSMKQNHPFHMVEMSPWPLVGAISTMLMLAGTVNMFQHSNKLIMMMGTFMVMLTMLQWWRDVVREGTYQGLHTKIVMKGLRWGMILFIISEVLFFVSFFWAFFNSSLSPIVQVGAIWPPMGINPFNPMQIPLLNTMILLSSGVSITWAHHSLLNNNMKEMNISLTITIMLGMYFTVLQAYEYIEAPFTISDSIYGSTFFMATGFHGLHVIIGSTFLLVCLMRQLNMHFSKYHHVGFEAAAWYWHFVDVVWLFLYLTIYWWGN